MAFTFDYTLSGENSNSYVPLDTYTDPNSGKQIQGANDYFEGHPKYDLWSPLTDQQKQQVLVQATRRLDVECYGGSKTKSIQRLQWPRNWIVQRNEEEVTVPDSEYYRSSEYLPIEMEQAVFELALWYIEEWVEQSPLFSRDDIERMEEVSIGPLSATLRKIKQDELPDIVKRSLRAIGPNGWLGERQLKIVR